MGLAAALGAALHTGLEPRAPVVERLRAYGAFEGCPTGGQRTTLGQVCMVIVHLTVEERGRRLYRVNRCSGRRGPYERMLDTLTRLCPDVVDAVSGCVTTWACIFSSVREGSWSYRHVRATSHLGRAFWAGRVASYPMGWVLRGCEWGTPRGVRHRHAAAGPGDLRAARPLSVSPSDRAPDGGAESLGANGQSRLLPLRLARRRGGP